MKRVMGDVRIILPLACVLVAAAVPAAAETKSLRVVCWNVRHGVGEDGKLDLPRIAAVILAQKPDIVALQEVDNRCARSGNIDQAAELARLTGLSGIFGKAMDYDGGGYGQALLSRHPITAHKVRPLPSSAEPRIAFEATLSVDGTEMCIVSVHLDLNAAKRLAQAETLTTLYKNNPNPIILCGDFNSTPETPTVAAIGRAWTAVPKNAPSLTYPAGKPTAEIDYFFVRGFIPKCPAEVLLETVASDHRPLLGEFVREH